MDIELTDGEKKIIRALNKLDKLWKLYGQDLVLFNGNSLRKGGCFVQHEIDFFINITGEGGDGGDRY